MAHFNWFMLSGFLLKGDKMITKKDYKAIAKCIFLSQCPDPDCDVESGINQGCQDIAFRLADYFENDNYYIFNRRKFLDACFQD